MHSEACVELLEERTVLSAGALDPSFDGDGRLTTDFGSSDEVRAIAIQEDGKIVAVGVSNSDSEWALARYLSNGSLDTSFGTNGKVITNFGYSNGAYDVAIQSDGKIVVVGDSGFWEYFTIARFNSDGSLDATFDGDGVAFTSFDSEYHNTNAKAVAIQRDGKIVVGGYTDLLSVPGADEWDFALARYNSDGSLDTSFGETDASNPLLRTGKLVTTDAGRIADIALQDDLAAGQKIVAVGTNYRFDLAKSFVSLVRYDSDGSLDPTFGVDGQVLTDFDRYGNDARAVAIQTDPILGDRILIAGSGGINSDIALARYTTTGSIDATFGNNGKVLTDLGGDEIAHGLAIQNDNKIVIGGATSRYSTTQFLVARYTPDGSLDASFDGDGKVITDFNSTYHVEWACDIAIQTDGKIVAAGIADQDFALARYLGDSPLLTLSINDVSITEGNSTTKTVAFTVSRLGSLSETVTVQYASSSGSAWGGSDYTDVSGSLTFNPGETTKTISVTIRGDTTYEPDETFFLNLFNSTNASLADDRGQATIINDDARPRVSISDVSIKEGRSGMVSLVFTVSLSNASYEKVTMNFATADGSASAGSDYETTSGTLTFNPGETTKTITVWIYGDTTKESDEVFYLDLSDILNADLNDGRATGTIVNDDH